MLEYEAMESHCFMKEITKLIFKIKTEDIMNGGIKVETI